MQTNRFKLLVMLPLLMTAGLFIASCDRDKDNGPDNEQELITTIRLTFSPKGGGAAIVATARDLDGDGGNPPVVEDVNLAANTDYNLSIAFLDESKSPVEDITKEVKEESDEHLVCLTGTGAMPTPTITDKDKNNRPLGLESTFRTGAAGNGTLKVTLKHKPNKTAANPCTTGETDAEQTFRVIVK